MNENEIWDAIISHRHATIDLLESLGPEEWSTPSLCDGWNVKHVAAHLTMQQSTVRDAVSTLVRQPSAIGGLNRIIDQTARRRVQWPSERILADLRRSADVRRHNVGITSRDALMDILVHSQDIALPLARRMPLPVDAAAEAASRVWAVRGTPMSKVFRRLPLEGVRLVATDTDWSRGEGATVTGPTEALLLLLTGRRVALARLTGEGATLLTGRAS